jgi:hypothetical protein
MNCISTHNAVLGETISVGIQRSCTTSNLDSLSKMDPPILKRCRNGPSECLSLSTRNILNSSRGKKKDEAPMLPGRNKAANVPTPKNDMMPKEGPERKEDRSTYRRQGNQRKFSFNKKELTTLEELISEYDRITGLHVSCSSLETVINMERESEMEKETGVELESAVSSLLSPQQSLETKLTSIDTPSPLLKAPHRGNTHACRAPPSRGVSRTYATSNLHVMNTRRRGVLTPQAGVEQAPPVSSLLSPQQSLVSVPTSTATLRPLVKAAHRGNTHACRAPPSRGVRRTYATSNFVRC